MQSYKPSKFNKSGVGPQASLEHSNFSWKQPSDLNNLWLGSLTAHYFTLSLKVLYYLIWKIWFKFVLCQKIKILVGLLRYLISIWSSPILLYKWPKKRVFWKALYINFRASPDMAKAMSGTNGTLIIFPHKFLNIQANLKEGRKAKSPGWDSNQSSLDESKSSIPPNELTQVAFNFSKISSNVDELW